MTAIYAGFEGPKISFVGSKFVANRGSAKYLRQIRGFSRPKALKQADFETVRMI